MAKQKDPNLKTTMRSIEDSEGDKSEEKAAGEAGEENTTDEPQSEEDEAGSEETEEGSEEGEEAEGDTKDGEEEPAERLEFFVDGEDDKSEPEPKDSRAFAKMRKTLRDRETELAELKRRLQAQGGGTDQAPDPGPEPDEADEDVNFDQAKLKKKHADWLRKVAERENWNAEQAKKAEAARQEARGIIEKHKANAASFSKMVKGYEEAEKTFDGLWDVPRQDILFRNTQNPAKVIYLLATRYPDLMDRLSKSNNRDEIIRELVKLEVTVKERKVGTPPAPGKRVGGSGSTTAQGKDPELEAARKKAAKTNNYTEVNRILRERREAERAKQRGK